MLICSVCGFANPRGQTRCLMCSQPLLDAQSNIVPMPPPQALPIAKGMLKQRYRILFAIGQGGMGTVYLGRDMQLGNRLVAIKEMSQSGLSPQERIQAAQNFKHEAHILAGLQHPHLPSIYDHFEENQRWYLVMSYIKGQTLEEYLKAQGGKLSLGEVLEIGSFYVVCCIICIPIIHLSFFAILSLPISCAPQMDIFI
ncbi:hypothetical protein KDK_78010 [Dictyobacter kobayashii]|uniref:non-specific serine/threonine protein kinase n=1 Tax=Dictyobacter kobayashii TaxID=2014872 RepID=A0A402AXZ0_9CHLR|nr:hypothetical protein KDK_78010 [Dictyobacter kobayashii]